MLGKYSGFPLFGVSFNGGSTVYTLYLHVSIMDAVSVLNEVHGVSSRVRVL